MTVTKRRTTRTYSFSWCQENIVHIKIHSRALVPLAKYLPSNLHPSPCSSRFHYVTNCTVPFCSGPTQSTAESPLYKFPIGRLPESFCTQCNVNVHRVFAVNLLYEYLQYMPSTGKARRRGLTKVNYIWQTVILIATPKYCRGLEKRARVAGKRTTFRLSGAMQLSFDGKKRDCLYSLHEGRTEALANPAQVWLREILYSLITLGLRCRRTIFRRRNPRDAVFKRANSADRMVIPAVVLAPMISDGIDCHRPLEWRLHWFLFSVLGPAPC